MGYTLSAAALGDILVITDYISADSPDAALRVRDDFFAAFERLSRLPGMGHSRPDLTSLPVRFWAVRRRYMVVYRDVAGAVEILRVLSGYRDIAAILGPANPE